MVALIRHEEEAAPSIGFAVVEFDPRQPRRDALPEHTHYRDSGCDLHHSCLSCPLVRCRYDEPGGARRLLSNDRDSEVLALQRGGGTILSIAQRVGVSRRTVFRILARARLEGEGDCS